MWKISALIGTHQQESLISDLASEVVGAEIFAERNCDVKDKTGDIFVTVT